jgi:hypothetical protein
MVVAKLSRAPYQWSPDADRLAGVSDAEIARRQVERNAAARAKLLSEFGALTGAQVAKRVVWRLGEVPSSETVRQWKRQGLVFTVNHQGRSVFPAFQFDEDGRPRPVVADVLATLGRRTTAGSLRFGSPRPVACLMAAGL